MAKNSSIVCPKCQGLPLRYRLVEDNSLIGAHNVGVLCRFCDGLGYIVVNEKRYNYFKIKK